MTISTNRNKNQTTKKKPKKEIVRSHPVISGKASMVLTGRADAEEKMMLVMFAQERSKQATFWNGNIKFYF